MNHDERNQLQMIRSLKGPPLTILFLLLVRNVSMTNQEICHWTGYTPNTVTPALRLLDALGFTQHNGKNYGWSIAETIQLSLPFLQLSTGGEQPVDKMIANFAIISDENERNEGELIANFAINSDTDTNFSPEPASYDDDHDDDGKDIADRLGVLGFDGAEKWIRGRNKRQIDAWLDWFDDPARRRRFESPAAFLRKKVEEGAWPPEVRPNRELDLDKQIPPHLRDIVKR
jgi:hypothetical protein